MSYLFIRADKLGLQDPFCLTCSKSFLDGSHGVLRGEGITNHAHHFILEIRRILKTKLGELNLHLYIVPSVLNLLQNEADTDRSSLMVINRASEDLW